MAPTVLDGIRKEHGHCWTVPLLLDGDDVTDPSRSALALYENGRELGPPHTNHGEIRTLGGGRYSHWEQVLYFSTSDNSDPRSNGRVYTVDVSVDRYFRGKADTALALLDFYLTQARLRPDALRGRVILEIGPGRHIGAACLMACLGARVVCVEPSGTIWDADWHPRYLEALIPTLL